MKIVKQGLWTALLFTLPTVLSLIMISGKRLPISHYAVFFAACMLIGILAIRIIPSRSISHHNKYEQSMIRYFPLCLSANKEEQLIKQFIHEIKNITAVKKAVRFNYDKQQQHSLPEISWLKNIDVHDFAFGEVKKMADGYLLLVGENSSSFIFIYLSHDQKRRKLKQSEIEWLRVMSLYTCIALQTLLLLQDRIADVVDPLSSEKNSPILSKVLFAISEKERTKLSQEIHDSIIQELIFICRELEGHIDGNNDLKLIRNHLLDNIQYLREKCFDLRPPFLMEMGLVESVKVLMEKYRSKNNIKMDLFVDVSDEAVLTEEIIINIYRIIQELLVNAVKHSKANYIVLTLIQNDSNLLVIYEDDGVGIDWMKVSGNTKHFGLTGIKERINSINGKHDMISEINEGLIVKVNVSI
ncbi:sensor histidine kinase [Bacillus swezeyi]|uniref:sensor histidine kinase n=1 Tax=Bacillus swezeyi TaxID=1925020 RepID=UPI003F89A3B9